MFSNSPEESLGLGSSADHIILLPARTTSFKDLSGSPATVMIASAVMVQTENCIPESVATSISQVPTLTGSISQPINSAEIAIIAMMPGKRVIVIPQSLRT